MNKDGLISVTHTHTHAHTQTVIRIAPLSSDIIFLTARVNGALLQSTL